MFETLAKAGKYLGQTARLMIGVPDYDNYVEHMRVTHPDQTPMTYEEFSASARMRDMGGKAARSAVDFCRMALTLIRPTTSHLPL